MMDPPPTWEERFDVRAHEIQPGHTSGVASMCNWLQEAAGNHATALGWGMPFLLDQGLTWVLSRFHLRVHRYPGWGETATVRTWPAGVQRLYALREFQIRDAHTEPLGVATSAWLLIKTSSRRPTRLHESLASIAERTPGRALADPFDKLPEATEIQSERRLTVRYSDLDINEHANNVSVITMALEGTPPETLRGFTLRELQIEFRAEARWGDEIIVRVGPLASANATLGHTLLRASDGLEVGRATSMWLPRQGSESHRGGEP